MANNNAHASQTDKDYRDLTTTPDWLFDACNVEFGFELDAAALPNSTKCEFFFTPLHDSLKQDWSIFARTVWLNPPYSNITPWCKKAIEQREKGVTTVMLIPRDNRTEWWHYVRKANEVREFVGYYNSDGKWRSGGVKFVDAKTGKPMKHELNKPMCLVIYRGNDYANVQYNSITKPELIKCLDVI